MINDLPPAPDAFYDPFFTGVITHAYQDKKGVWRSAYFENGCWMGGTVRGGQSRTPEEWAKANHTRCKICHPSPVPPFPDCPHGHYLTPSRIEAQLQWSWISDFGWYTAIWILSCFFMAIFWPVAAFVTFLYALNMGGYFIERRIMRKDQEELLRAGPWAENPNFKWEKRTRRNEPWVQRVF